MANPIDPITNKPKRGRPSKADALAKKATTISSKDPSKVPAATIENAMVATIGGPPVAGTNAVITATYPELRTPSTRENVRMIVRGGYDLQQLRIQMGNRIVAQFKAKLGQRPSKTEEEDLDEDAKTMLADLRADFKKLMDGVKKVRLAVFKATPLISNYTEFCLLQNYLELEESEKRCFANLGEILMDFPIYTKYLKGVKGIGPAIAGVIISEIDITRARHPSSLAQYAGLGVEADGRGTSKRKEHLKTIPYTDKDGHPAERQGITYNPFLKTKLMGVCASSFIKQSESPWRQIYLNCKTRYENEPAWAERTKGHRHNAAMRYMIKQFLIELYTKWRTLEGLPVSEPYHIAKLGREHGGSANGRDGASTVGQGGAS